MARELWIFALVITSTVLWGLDNFALTKGDMTRLDVVQLTMIFRMSTVPRRNYACWLDWFTANRRRARRWMTTCGQNLWGDVAHRRYASFAGHIARMDDNRLVKRAARHEQLIHWRIVQDHLPTGGPTHPLRHRRLGVRPCVWEVPLEKLFATWQRSATEAEKAAVTSEARRDSICWWDLALDRSAWYRIIRSTPR